MRAIRLIMGMPITLDVVDGTAADCDPVFAFLEAVDQQFSPFIESSELSRLNRGEVEEVSGDMRYILDLAEQTRQETHGYFDIWHRGVIDTCGVVKGWAIQRAADMLRAAGFANYYVDAGGDAQLAGHNAQGNPWRVGIRNPFDPETIVKTLDLTDCGIATSGQYERGPHIYSPRNDADPLDEIVSLTVIGPSVRDADRYATAAFAMGQDGIAFIAGLPGFECYVITAQRQATYTPGFAELIALDPGAD